jgi:hypothetical protein
MSESPSENVKEIQKLLQDLPDQERDFLPEGFQLKKEKEVQSGSGSYNLPKHKFPTFFCFEELKKENNQNQKIELDVEEGKKISLKMFTDAELDYFERKISPGKLSINWTLDGKNIEPEGYNGPFLKTHGLCTISKISLPANCKPGETLNLEILVKDKVNKDGFKLEASIFVKPEQKTIKIKKFLKIIIIFNLLLSFEK